MKATRQVLAIIIAISVLFSALPAMAGLFSFSSETNKAQEKLEKAIGLMAINLNDEAYKLVNEAKATATEELISDPNNNQALYVLAQAETYLNNLEKAKTHFQKACQRDPSLCENIYRFYEKLAETHKKMGSPELMISYKIEACNYQPGAKEKLAESFFRDGAKLLSGNNYHPAAIYFQACASLNPGYSTAIATAIRDSAKRLSDPCAQMVLYRYALNYSPPAMNQELFQLAAQVLKDCDEQAVKKEFNMIRPDYRSMIRNIAYPPDYINCKRGDKPTFQLKAGEYSPYMRAEYGTDTSFLSNNGKYKICYRNGNCYIPSELPKYGTEDFRFLATADCKVRAVFQ